MFAFRIATGQGIGHLMRMKWIALELQQRGQASIFILDQNANDLTEYLQEIDSQIYYVPSTFAQNEIEDANFCLQIINQFPDIKNIILDSYELGLDWQKQIKSDGLNLVVFDDLAREHLCDLLFDQKWQGENTHKSYDGRLPEHCQAYLGPDYCMLAPKYRGQHTSKETNFLKDSKPKLLLSLGGGGDLSLLVGLLSELFALDNSPSIEVELVIGPQAQNVQLAEAITAKHANVKLLYQPTCLAEHYFDADLFVGALGTSLYELAATKTPAITFSLADNQQNKYQDLASLGHYLHLPYIPNDNLNRLAQLIVVAFDNLPRLKELRSEPAIDINAEGVSRICDILLSTEPLKEPMAIKLEQRVHQYSHHFNDNISIRKVTDRDINHYLESRNMPNNAERMTVKTEIDPLEHYIWWFSNKRESYVLCQDHKPLLYIWHGVYPLENTDYLYGGWFTAKGEVPFNIAMLALKWQLEHTESLYPNGHWLAVINKNNKFVNLLNQYMGFSDIEINSLQYKVTQTLFPKATDDVFNYVELDFRQK